MRILISNPDSLGDFVLRQPLFQALSEEGHQLQLLVRPSVKRLAPFVAPEAELVVCALSPYDPDFEVRLGELAGLASEIEEFAPERIIVPAYQRTLLDEYVMGRFPGVQSIGLDGFLFRGHASLEASEKPGLRFTETVSVQEASSDWSKNQSICAAILGRSVLLPPPRIPVEESLRAQARGRLSQLNVEPGKFWVSCVGFNRGAAIRGWSPPNWGQALASIVDRHKAQFLLLGTQDESDATEEVRRHMGDTARYALNLCSTPESLEMLVGLTAESAGYIGKDTGPMHIAAALSKPVVAVFGGAHWPRFVPAAPKGGAVTVVMPCAGCDWLCHLQEPHCIRQVPASAIVDEFSRSLTEDAGFRVTEIQPPLELSQRLAVEAAESARQRIRGFNASILGHQAEESRLQLEIRSGEKVRGELTEELQRLQGELVQLRVLYEALQQEHSALQQEHAGAESRLDAVRRSIFARILVKMRIWNVWD